MNANFVPTVLTKKNLLESIFQGWNHNRVETRWIAWPSLLRRLLIRIVNVYGLNVGKERVEAMDTLPFVVDVGAELDYLDGEPEILCDCMEVIRLLVNDHEGAKLFVMNKGLQEMVEVSESALLGVLLTTCLGARLGAHLIEQNLLDGSSCLSEGDGELKKLNSDVLEEVVAT